MTCSGSVGCILYSDDSVPAQQGLMDSARHVIKRNLNPRSFHEMTSYEVAKWIVIITLSNAFRILVS